MSEIKPLFPELEIPDAIDSPDAMAGALSSQDVPFLGSKVLFLETLFQLLTKDLTFHEFMREVMMTYLKVVRCEAASILEVDYANESIFFRAASGQGSDRVVRFVIPLGQGIVGHVVESQQPFIVSDVNENKKHLSSISEAVGFKVNNMVALPIVIRGKVYGVLELLNRVGEDEFTEADVELLNYLCGILSKAIELRLMIAWKKQSEAKRA